MASNGGPTQSVSNTFSASGGVNYAAKYADKIDERFSLASVVAPATNNDYSFDGVNKVTVLNIDTVPLTDYTPYGSNRFGSPVELGNGEQTLELTQRRSFAFTIDARSPIATQNTMLAAAALDRQLREVCVPAYDNYVLKTLYSNVKTGNKASANLTKDTAYAEFLKAQNAMGNARVPLTNRTAFMSYELYSMFKLGGFTTDSDKGQEIKQTGEVGKIDGTKIILVPSDLLTFDMGNNTTVSNVHCIVIASNLVIAPRPISYYNSHNNPPGIHGTLVEGEFLYDCFVLNNKKDAIYVITQSP